MNKSMSYSLKKKSSKRNSPILPLSAEEEDFGWFCCRHTLALLGFLGIASVYAMRVNLSVAIVAMVNHTQEHQIIFNDTDIINTCPSPGNQHSEDNGMNGEFEWDEHLQSLVLGSFFYGYVITNIPGGRAAEYFGGRTVMGLGVIITGILTVLSPLAAKYSTTLFIIVRVLEGCAEGVTFPAMNVLISKWYPKKERSKFTSFIYAGLHFGTVISLSLSGYLCGSSTVGGWPAVFYVFGGLGVLWGVLWFSFVKDSPMQQSRISEAELRYVVKGCPETERLPVPWLSILSSKYFWVISISNFGSNWGLYTLMTEVPTYLNNIQHINIKNNGLLSALPYLGAWLFSILYSISTHKLIEQDLLTIVNVRRLSMVVGGYLPMFGLIGMCFVDCNETMALIILVLTSTMNSASLCGYMSSQGDIAPRFAGTVMGLTNTIASTTGFLAPQMAGYLTQNNQTLSAWRNVFMVAAAIFCVTVTLYVTSITADVQPWNDPHLNENKVCKISTISADTKPNTYEEKKKEEKNSR